MELNERLKQLRKIKAVTQVQVANGCNMAERAYQRIEAGNKPSYDALLALADYFDAVSYTHLDVYKRQPLGSSSAVMLPASGLPFASASSRTCLLYTSRCV